MRQLKHRLPWLAAALTATLLTAACTGPSPVQVSQPTTERQLEVVSGESATERSLAHILAGALKHAGVEARVSAAAANPADEVIKGAADATMIGSTDLLTELRAAGSSVLESPGSETGAAADPAPTGLTAQQTLDRLRALQLKDLAVLPSAAADDRTVLTVSAATAERFGLRSLNDLGVSCPELAFGAPGEIVMSGAPKALADDYSCAPASLIALDPLDGSLLNALLTDRIQVALLDSGAASIPDNALVRLEDPKSIFPAQQLTPLLTTKDLGQDAIDAINQLTRKLDQEQLIDLNRTVSGPDALDPKTAADYWLVDHGLGGA